MFEVDGVFADVAGEVADALEGADDENEVEVILAAALSVLDAAAELGGDVLVQFIEFLVAQVKGGAERAIMIAVGGNGIAQKLGGEQQFLA